MLDTENATFKVQYFINMIENVDWRHLSIVDTQNKEKTIVKMAKQISEPLEQHLDDYGWNSQIWDLLTSMHEAMIQFQLKERLCAYGKMWDAGWEQIYDEKRNKTFVLTTFPSKQHFLDTVEREYMERKKKEREHLQYMKSQLL